jgi:hypothetical protein
VELEEGRIHTRSFWTNALSTKARYISVLSFSSFLTRELVTIFRSSPLVPSILSGFIAPELEVFEYKVSSSPPFFLFEDRAVKDDDDAESGTGPLFDTLLALNCECLEWISIDREWRLYVRCKIYTFKIQVKWYIAIEQDWTN